MQNNFDISDILEASKNERSAHIQIEKTEDLTSPSNSEYFYYLKKDYCGKLSRFIY